MDKSTPLEIVDAMMQRDTFSQWLGVTVLSVDLGYAEIEMTVRSDMMNGLGIAHGGIVYSLADSALAFAANSHGTIAVALSNQVSYPAPVSIDDILRATCKELTRTRKTASYDVTVVNQDDTIVGLFRGMVYRKSNPHSKQAPIE